MALDIVELSELASSILEAMPDMLLEAVTRANRTGQLEALLSLLGMSDFLGPSEVLDTYTTGKILVIGESAISAGELRSVAKKQGIDSDRFEFVLDYDDAKKYYYAKLQYNSNYRVVIFGPMPHSSNGKGDYSSTFARMQNERDVYPRVIQALNGNSPKITKSSFGAVIK